MKKVEQTSLKNGGLLLKGAVVQYTTVVMGNTVHRYLMRTATHPKLRKDPDFINFLEDPNEVCAISVNCSVCCMHCTLYVCTVYCCMYGILYMYYTLVQLPKAKETSAVSGAGFMRLVRNVGDSISKMTSKMSESDEVLL